MNPDTTILVSDLDGVLVDTYTQLQRFLWDRFRVWVPFETFDTYMLYEPALEYLRDAGISKQELPTLDAMRKVIDGCCWKNPEFFRNALPYVKYWQALLTWPGSLRFATSRKPFLESVTVEWLQRHGFSNERVSPPGSKCYDDLVFVENKASYLVGVHNENVRTSLRRKKVVLIDDRPETILAVDALNDDRIIGILVEYPWSVGHDEKYKQKVMLRKEIIAWLGGGK